MKKTIIWTALLIINFSLLIGNCIAQSNDSVHTEITAIAHGDTATLVTTTSHSALSEIGHSLQPIGWVLLVLGWLMYWLKNLNAARQTNKQLGTAGKIDWIRIFFADNFIEIPVSILSCLVLAILAPSIPPSLMDMRGMLSIFMVGYTASSMLNGLITTGKGAISKP